MARAIQLARNATGTAAPNPMVGAVLVQGDRILAEGWHKQAGGPHAEVECLRAFGDGPVPEDAVMVLNLEPCSHHGRTPPCADMLVERGVKHVVVAHADPFPEVAGKGIARLRGAGVRVDVGVREAEARWMNRRFLTSVNEGRPYVILKWARSADGRLDAGPRTERVVQRITGADSHTLVHRWRSEEQAILVGSRTVINDDPELTVRLVAGRSPLRVVLDRDERTPAGSRVYGGGSPALLFTGRSRADLAVDQVIVPKDADPISTMFNELHHRQVRSLLVEGGAMLLQHFIERDLWDEARVFTGPPHFGKGTPAPDLPHAPFRTEYIGEDLLHRFHRTQHPADAWCW